MWYWITGIGITLSVFAFMEFVAWSLHKYVMHGFLWFVHKDHHNKTPGFFERNDFFFLIFAIPSWLFMMFGIMDGADWKMWVGIGITLYGIAYFTVHEVIIHQRFKFLKNVTNVYFAGLRKAHRVHHKKLGKEDGECFGMLLVPRKYFEEAKRALHNK
ncbi:MAG: beta-carotene hydroxylase [Chitinophagales bacterium]